MDGYIKLHRKFTSWEWYTTPNMFHLFSHLIMMASHKKSKYQGIELNPGQLITGRKLLSKQTGLSQQTVRTCLTRLKSTNELTIKTTNRFSIITICNYDSYQLSENGANQQINQHSNQQLTNNQPTTNHIQECKEGIRKNNIQTREKFYKTELTKNDQEEYFKYYDFFVKYLWGQNPINQKLKMLKLKDQIDYAKFYKLFEMMNYDFGALMEICLNMHNYSKTYTSFYLTLRNWVKRDIDRKS